MDTTPPLPPEALPQGPDDGPGTPDDGDLGAAVRGLKRASVLVIGDVMLDRYVYGTVERISPEAPIPVIAIEREATMPGGAGNVVRNLVALGAAAAFVSVVGDDAAGSDLTALVGGQPGVEPWLLVQGGRTTTMKTRYIAAGQQLLRADREQSDPIHPKLADRLVRIGADAVRATAVTVLSDYKKGVFGPDTALRLIQAAKDAGRRVLVDPKGPDWSRYGGADLITPNRRELAEGSGLPAGTEEEIVAASRALIAAHGFGAVLTTRSEDGMTLVWEAGARVRHYPAEAAEVFDVSGAGDTVLATVAAGLASGLALPVATRLANIAAGLVVGKIGTAVARPEELLEAVAPATAPLRKVLTRDAVAEQIERWRRRGFSIGFTNGCFDLLHPGHVHLLAQARAACDRLVVGLNSDASVKRLKGPTRPVQNEAARAAVLASLAAVDAVVVFEEDTPEALLQHLRPDLLVKGADYALDQVVGRSLVEGFGGRVMLAELLPGNSTTATIARLRG